MAKIAFVVHRYYPYPGGSENTVRRAAEALQQAGHDVAVYAAGNMGAQNNVDVNYDISTLYGRDLVIIHGAGVWVQDQVIRNINHIDSPIVFWLIRPDETTEQSIAIRDAALVGYTTKYDIERVKKEGIVYEDKLSFIPHILSEDSIGNPGFKEKYGIESKKMILSSGGFWPHKGHQELINVFESDLINHSDTTLVITGYTGENHGLTYTSNQVKILYLPEMSDVYDAMHEADLYVMNSYDEGFGLVLLEAMQNKLHWISRHIAGADTLKEWGVTYTDTDSLMLALKQKQDVSTLDKGYSYILENHTNNAMVSAVESMLKRVNPCKDETLEQTLEDGVNLVLVTSVINAPSNLSIHSSEERFLQLKEQTIPSIRKKIPNSFIVLIEGGEMDDFTLNKIETTDADHVFYTDVKTLGKSMGEISMINVFLSSEKFKVLDDENSFTEIYKISGRYFLTDEFVYKKLGDNAVFKMKESGTWSGKGYYITRFYGFGRKMLPQFIQTLKNLISVGSLPIDIEHSFYEHEIFPKKLGIINNKLGVSGTIAPSGEIIND